MPSANLLRQNGLRCIGEFMLRGSVKSSSPGISCFFFEQAFSTSRRSINPIPQLGPCSGTLTERGPVDPQKAAPVVGTLSRTFALPSVSGISYQSYYNRDQLLSQTCQRPLHSPLQGTLMAACGSLLGGAKPPVLNFDSLNRRNGRMLSLMIRVDGATCAKWIECCGRVSMRLKNRQPHGTNMVYRCFWSYAGDKSWGSINNPFLEAGAKYFHVSSAVSNSAGAAPDVSFDGSIREEQFENSAVSSDQKVLGDRTLKLLSGSCYLPHPAKEETGGEDAHFIVDGQAIGVADGVGGWADLGVNAGHYARELMSRSVSVIQEEPEGSIDPARVLEKAYSRTKAKGSSTACIIALTDQGIHAVNLGDSGFIVVRDGCTIFRSPVQQHDFNFTYQLESGNHSDLPSAAQVYTFPVALGDVVIAGTDGLFDNLYNNEITAVVVQAVRAGSGPQVAAQKIAALARQRAQDKNRQTPFSTAAQDAGYRYHGGKLDDITVVISYITATNK